ncbi:Zinc finger PMZ-type [Arabidopsis thaliana x Arabidopsis arenosa]|uniref:Zinc finger PMZ-type n=1 Tax=Arabidopsis thaliana x Arabidopsis arenosa TaxID=1240361 RepID=A0A8T2C8M2_9BRAS|nr:Zinc finger PMZ-type [Arabidopsis thaliana x Arabidopsis arenosa]
MAESEVVVLCYWNCHIKHGPDGVYFEGSTPKEMRVKKKTDFSRFLDELYLITGFDKQKSKLEIVARYPVVQSPNKFRYLLHPVANDFSLEKMLEVPSNHPCINAVEFYLEAKPTSNDPPPPAPMGINPHKRQKSRQHVVGKRQKTTQQEVGDSGSGSTPRLVSGLWLDDDTMRVGLCFKDINEMKKAVDWWSIKRQKKYLVRETDKDMVQPMLSIAQLDKWWKEKFGYALDAFEEVDNDAQGVLEDAKVKAIKKVFGDWDQSFRFIPKLMYALHSSNGLLVDWQYDSLPNPEHASFRSVFWSFSQSIQGFQHCRPLIVVDTKNLGGKYKMKLMIASAFDAVNEYFPLAFAVTKEVSVDSWRWFLSRIREKVTQRQGICLISSPDPDILAVINEPGSQWKEPWAYHRFCLDHLCSKFGSVSPGFDHNMEYLVEKAGSSSQKGKFDSYMKEIKEKNPEGWKWLDQFPPHQWALAHDDGWRYGIMRIRTKALFAHCKRFQKVAMAGGVMLMFGELRDAFDESFSRSRGSLNRGNVYTEHVMEKLEEFTKDSVTCVVTPLERDAFEVSTVSKKKKRYMGVVDVSTRGIVQLNDSTCTCGKFQRNKFPCLHALAVCDNLKINPLQYVDDCYTLERYHKTYAATFSPVPELSAWPEACGVPILLPPVIESTPPKVSGKGKEIEDDHLEEDEEEDGDDDDNDEEDDDDDEEEDEEDDEEEDEEDEEDDDVDDDEEDEW